MKTTVFSSIRSIIKRIPFQGMVPAFMVFALTLFPLLASADEDPCRKTGVFILNQTQVHHWFTRNEGPCTHWTHNFLLTIKPEDVLIIYKDLECKKEQFSKIPTYDDYKSLDANQNCRVRILFDGTLSDL